MKITHRKQKGERYALVFETTKEAKLFAHYVRCKQNPQSCTFPESQTREFWARLMGVVLGKVSLPIL